MPEDGVVRGKEWFAGVMWEEMPEDAKERLRDGDRDE